MVLEVDVKAFIQNLRATKPPYKCPYGNCEKVYKSYSGIQHHLYHFDHDNPEPAGQTPKSGSKPHKKKGGHNKHHHRSIQRSPSPQERIPTQPHTRETLSYKESQRMVEISLGGQTFCVDIYQPLDVISQDEIDNQNNTEKEEKEERSMQKPAKGNENGKSRKENATAAVPSQPAKLPEVQVKVLEDYIRPKMPPTPSSSYYRHIEKTAEELDEEVEYDMDEEDHVWLDMMNETRTNNSTAVVSQEAFETLMDRFEKEAFFQSQSAGKDQGPSIDEDAVCSICMDGECQNTNVILFCDMCNLAVHQECYGVPYIPEGQWLCRRCLQSPSRAVDCVLCPNKGGAFKQTDDGRWAHVVCALWVPEVGFANTVFLEPIDCLERIPPARKKLTCYVCKQRGSGACIQCHRPNCYTAFHVTCAQQAGLYMKIEPDSMPAGVKKTALCDVHMSPDSEWTPMMVNSDSPDQKTSLSPEDAKAQRRKKMRRARKILESRRKAIPVISIPTIPENRLSEIASLVDIPKKDQFLKCLQSYWTLKRQSRFGVPLLKRLQSNHMNRNKENCRFFPPATQQKNDKQSSERQEQLQYWQHIRQNLEKARLLTELVRKREKVKREWVNVRMLCFEYELQPFVVFLRSILQQLQEFDTDDIFAQPVSLEEVPDYHEVVQHPMDFSTMKSKVESHSYRSFDQFTKDFDLIVRNCMDYNEDDTVYYEAAVKLKKEGGVIIEAARKQVEQVGYDMDTGLHLPLTSNSQSPEGMEEGKECYCTAISIEGHADILNK